VGAPEQYGDELSREFKYIATWPAQGEVSLGDVGVFQGREFEVNTTLTELGIGFVPHTEPAVADWGFASDGAVAIDGSGAGGVHGQGVGLKLSGQLRFTRENAVFFRATAVVLHRVDNLDALKQALVKCASDGNWQADWRVVTHVAVAETFLLMLGGSGTTSAEVAIEGGPVPATAQDLATGSAKVGLERAYGLSLSIDAGRATPFFQAYRINRTLGVGPLKASRVGAKGRLRPEPVREQPDEEQAIFDWEPHSFSEE